MVPRTVDPRFPSELRRLRNERGLSVRALAALAHQSHGLISDLETGRRPPLPDVAERLETALAVPPGTLTAMVDVELADDDGLDAVELARRVTASDVRGALPRLEGAVDGLAMAYARRPPEELLPRARRSLDYVGELLDKRKTLDEHRRLLVAGGWLSLLAATLRIDLRHRRAADSHLATARELAEQTEHREIQAWCWETEAWDVLTTGDYARAVDLSQQAQDVAPAGSSALIQATAQEGRAWARMGRGKETRDALGRVERLVSPLPRPERPEHHYQYDPAKALSYTATTLAWVGDAGAEAYARTALDELEAANDGVQRPRRIASARLDLGLALLAAEKADEAADAARLAITSGRVVASNWWRATEIVKAVEEAGVGEAASELRDAYETFKPRPQHDRVTAG
jgi:transcriptional regulator with XRE-family HTH domain